MTTLEQVRGKLRRGEPTIGTWMQLADDSVAEIMGAAGFDWVAIDLEHGRFAEAQLPSLFRAIEATGTLPFVRLGEVSAYRIKAALDAGAKGLILPMIESAEQLERAVSWAMYPPRGTRGVGYSRANLFGSNFDTGISAAPPLIVAQIEHIRAVDGIDALLSVSGLDAIMIGPYDLSASIGATGAFGDEAYKRALSTVIAACKRHGVPCGLHVVQPDEEALRQAIAAGHRFVAYGTDAVFLWKSAKRPEIARQR